MKDVSWNGCLIDINSLAATLHGPEVIVVGASSGE
jgi:hypothetical protein